VAAIALPEQISVATVRSARASRPRTIRHGASPRPLDPFVPRSVTVVAETCTQAGMLATLAMLRGRTAEAFLEEQRVKHWCFR